LMEVSTTRVSGGLRMQLGSVPDPSAYAGGSDFAKLIT